MLKVLGALQKVQNEIKSLKKDTYNTFYRSYYTSLSSIREELQPLLSANKLVLIQPLNYIDGKMFVETILIHLESGEQLKSVMPVVSKNENDPQQLGSSISYARRYSLLSLLFLTPDDGSDDDGNLAAEKTKKSSAEPVKAQPASDNVSKVEVKKPTFKKPAETKEDDL